MSAPSILDSLSSVPPAAFDVCGPLPRGTTMLEASAGTGKTFTIAALAARFIAEGHATLDQVMLVTFSRAATQELRERVRERLTTAARALGDPTAARSCGDPVLVHLADADETEVALRRARLLVAVAGFDAATIATTHQFCQQVLRSLGIGGVSELDAALVENLDDLRTEVVDDLYLRRWGQPGAPTPMITRAEALRIAREAVNDPQARLEPAEALRDTRAGTRRSLGEAVRRELAIRKRRLRVMGYDDLLSRLCEALHDEANGEAACRRLRDRYRIVLVDEFQDTDPVQWKILRRAFSGHTTLVLIGDPKQAIYAFRGADVVTYLEAADEATLRSTLTTNWRSDSDLLAAFDAIFGGAALGNGIVVGPVEASHRGRRVTDDRGSVPLELRVVPRHLLTVTNKGLPSVGSARAVVARDVAATVVQLFEEALVGDTHTRPLSPGDVAVIVRTNAQAEMVRDALRGVRVPAVLGGGPSVFLTSTAKDWLVLLQALEQPHRSARVRAAALTLFIGWTAEQLATADRERLDELATMIRRWSLVLATRGVAALLEAAMVSQQIPQRLLACVDGERELTDLRHIGQTLHVAAMRGQLGLTALAQWLRARIADARADNNEERTRRLESDADAVQVLTVHRSKGLEFPVVLLPYAWDRWVPEPDFLLLHDESGARVRDVGGPSDPGWRRRLEQHRLEEADEDLRLLYVALTRAQSRVVAWWAPSSNTSTSALHRLVFATFDPGSKPADEVPVPDDDVAVQRLDALAERVPGAIGVRRIEEPDPRPWVGVEPATSPLQVASFDRTVDIAWRRTSYSALTAGVHESQARVMSEPDTAETDDEATPEVVALGGVRAPVGDDIASPMAALPAGTSFGTLVHAVLEQVDTSAADLEAEVAAKVADQLAMRPTRGVAVAELTESLLPVLSTPLGSVWGDRRLRDIAPHDRLAELDFELPLAGGEHPHAEVFLRDVAVLMRRHIGSDDPLAAYPDALDVAELRDQQLRGFLTGSIDAVFRLPGPVYVVADYKTNRFGAPGEPLSAASYRGAAMAEAMVEAHYPLQALLYAVALHRYLRWRQPEYDPMRHLGGVAYLFLRGMCGPATPVLDGMVCGVFGWRPPAALITELSDLLDRGGAR